MSNLLARTGMDRLPRGAACGMTRMVLYGVESGTLGIPSVLRRHRGACLFCQAATVRQRHVMRGLASLRHEFEPLPSDLTSILDQPMEVASEDHADAVSSKRRSVVTAVASAASIAAIGLVVVAGRRIRSQAG